ncbi:helix-turn-helix domain-containing protein [Plesiomonas shigelloides]|uniref:helix-turn-helix domain-containing protein n=1 Tax=Plesiomonas shigelloides TaxID=703 RepID=UPI00143E32FE|nr:helix-turn-helix domain-containing protein [Plesiomonas shigelloides]QIY07727.1 helix-turn-helix domain-containing protein [Plesiomonas shigelloides]
MSFQAMAEAVKAPLADSNKLVLIMMAHCADDVGFCSVSQVSLSEVTGLSEKAIRSIISRLKKTGYLSVVKGGYSGTPTVYQLHLKQNTGSEGV